jgi:hypothetical protein
MRGAMPQLLVLKKTCTVAVHIHRFKMVMKNGVNYEGDAG